MVNLIEPTEGTKEAGLSLQPICEAKSMKPNNTLIFANYIISTSVVNEK
jgi:hypothetical protein